MTFRFGSSLEPFTHWTNLELGKSDGSSETERFNSPYFLAKWATFTIPAQIALQNGPWIVHTASRPISRLASMDERGNHGRQVQERVGSPLHSSFVLYIYIYIYIHTPCSLNDEEVPCWHLRYPKRHKRAARDFEKKKNKYLKKNIFKNLIVKQSFSNLS